MVLTATRSASRYAPCPDCDGLRDTRARRCSPCHLALIQSRMVPLESRYWAKVDRRGPDECWPWLGATARNGYGKVILDGRLVTATHVSLMLDGRPRPVGLLVRHTCDNPPCVNPRHLLAGTVADNSRDMMERGRSPAKLTRPQVASIKRGLLDGKDRRALASETGVSKSTIDAIATGRVWSRVQPAEFAA